MSKKKYYAVKLGQDPTTKEMIKNRIFESWAESQPYVQGVKGGSEYKSFPTLEQAEEYLKEKDPLMKKSENTYPKDALYCYIDGSYNDRIPNYGYGLICVKNNKLIHSDSGIGTNTDAIKMRQIGGELLGAIKAILFAKKNNYKKVVIFHDYEGVCYHAIGYWKRDNEFSKTYYEYMQKFFKENPDIKIYFCKVDAHTGDDFNELADGLAKKAVGLEPNSIYYKILEKIQQ